MRSFFILALLGPRLLGFPMRSFFILALLGVVLVTIAFVVRSGMLARKDPGKPINSAMRAALETPQFSGEDAMIIAQKYPLVCRARAGRGSDAVQGPDRVGPLHG